MGPLRSFTLVVFLSLSGLAAQVQVIPQVADGGGWATTIVLTNTTATAQAAVLKFHQTFVGGGGATKAWNPPFIESNISLTAINLAAGATLFLHTAGTAATLTQGWGELDPAGAVVGYAIFTSHAPGNPAQDATAPAVTASGRILVPFDNTSGLQTAVAVVNPNAGPETITVNIRTSNGAVSTTTLPSLAGTGQQTFLMPAQFAATAGMSGLAEFYTNTGTIAAIALRANPSGAFTTAPVYPESGAPIIGANLMPVDIGVSAVEKAAVRDFSAASQSQVITQVADGDGWASTIALVNTSASVQIVTLKFRQGTSGGATAPWNPPFKETVSLASFALPGGSALFLHTPGTAAALTQGWGELVADAAVVGYAIFTSKAPGNPAQDATAPAGTATSRILVPFDDTSGFIAAIAIASAEAVAETISVNIRTSDGSTSTSMLPILPANGQTTFLMPTQFPGTAGKSGLAEFFVTSGTFSIIALRANPSGAFTAAPVYFESGAPIITTGGGGGGAGGDIVDAGIQIEILTATSGATTIVSDVVSGAISRYSPAEWNTPYAGPKFGPCVVYDATYPTGSKFPSTADAFLDAGATLGLSGPGVSAGTMVPGIPSAMGPLYRMAFPAGTFTPGGTYTLTGTGGSDVSAFTISATLPNAFTITNWDALGTISRGGPVTITWTQTGVDELLILLSGSAVSGANTHTVVIGCAAPASTGTFTLPAGALALLPAVPAAVPPRQPTSTLLVSGLKGPVAAMISPESSTLQTFLPMLVAGGQANYGAFAPSITFVRLPVIQ